MFTGKSEEVKMNDTTGNEKHTGAVYIYFSNYKINKWLSEDLFKEEENK